MGFHHVMVVWAMVERGHRPESSNLAFIPGV